MRQSTLSDDDRSGHANRAMHPIDVVDRRSQSALEVPLLRFLGASLLDRTDGFWSIGLTPGPDALNAVDALHGGVIATVLDVAAYLAVVPHLSTKEEAITIAFSGSYIAPAPPSEQLRATGAWSAAPEHSRLSPQSYEAKATCSPSPA